MDAVKTLVNNMAEVRSILRPARSFLKSTTSVLKSFGSLLTSITTVLKSISTRLASKLGGSGRGGEHARQGGLDPP